MRPVEIAEDRVLLTNLLIGDITEHGGRRRLTVGVDDQNPIPLQRQVMGEVDTGRRLTDTPFEVLAGDHHWPVSGRIPPRQRPKVLPESLDLF